MLLAQGKRKFGILCVYLDDMKERKTIKNKKKQNKLKNLKTISVRDQNYLLLYLQG